METRNKNFLIGGLIATVLIMAVGYAAFATQLNVSATSTINTTWNVHFKNGSETVKPIAGFSGAREPITTKAGTANATKAVAYSNSDLTATIYTDLQQPGDVVEYDFVIINEGSFDAKAKTPILTVSNADYTSDDGKIARKGHIQYEITQLPKENVIAPNEEAVMKLTVSFVDTITGTCSNSSYTNKTACEGNSGTWTESQFGKGTTGSVSSESASVNITLIYVQN